EQVELPAVLRPELAFLETNALWRLILGEEVVHGAEALAVRPLEEAARVADDFVGGVAGDARRSVAPAHEVAVGVAREQAVNHRVDDGGQDLRVLPEIELRVRHDAPGAVIRPRGAGRLRFPGVPPPRSNSFLAVDRLLSVDRPGRSPRPPRRSSTAACQGSGAQRR